MVYNRPEMLTCSKNFNVLITDGEPTEDRRNTWGAGQLPDYSATLGGRTGCTGTGDGACLDDIGEYLANVDINPTLMVARRSSPTRSVSRLTFLYWKKPRACPAASTCWLTTRTHCWSR